MKEIILKAISGGYKLVPKQTHYVYLDNNGADWQENLELDVLDPLFWQALGKACGWENKLKLTGFEYQVPGWRAHALRFHEINLTEGWKSAVKYLSDLTK